MARLSSLRTNWEIILSLSHPYVLPQLTNILPVRPIGAVVFMQRGIFKMCLRSTDKATNTSEIAKVSPLCDSMILHGLI